MQAALETLGVALAAPYAAVSLAIVCSALAGAFGLRARKLHGYEVPIVLAWAAVFFLVYQVLDMVLSDGVGYTLGLALNLGGELAFALLLVGGEISERLALLVSCSFSVTSMRSTVTVLFGIFADELLFLGEGETVVFYLALYAAQAGLAVLFTKYPVRPAPSLPTAARWLLLGIPVCMAFISQAQMLLNSSYVYDANWETFFFQLLAMVAMLASYYLLALVTRAYDQLMEEEQVNQRLELSLDHAQRSSAIVDQVRRDKHELKNNYLYLRALLAEGRLDELSHFLEVEMVEHFDELTEFHTGNETLDYLLAQKASEARKTGARVCFEVIVPADLGLSDRDLCGLLGNLLDNAIDASRAEVEAGNEAEVRLTMRTVRSYLSIQVQNRSSKDVLRANPHLRTTKQNAGGHGIGLKVVRTIVAQHGGSFETEMEGGNFVATALLEL